jgi:hypothetical protein
MPIELTTASEDTIKELKRALGIATIDVLLPNHTFSTVVESNNAMNSFTVTLPSGKAGIVDFTNFGRFQYFNMVANINIVTIIGASSLVNLENIGTRNALNLASNTNMPLSAINTLIADLPTTTKTATINLQGITAVPQSNYKALTGKGYSVLLSFS